MGSTGKKSNISDPFQGHLGERVDVDSVLSRLSDINANNLINPSKDRVNCALCVSATILNAVFGYDVEAMPRDKTWRGPDSLIDVDYSNPDNFMISGSRYRLAGFPSRDEIVNEYKVNPDDMPITPKGANAVSKTIIDKVKRWGEDSLGMLAVRWKGSGAHIITVFNQDGNVYGYDPQINRVIYDLKSYLATTVATRTDLARVDNATIKDNIDKNTLDKMVKKRKK